MADYFGNLLIEPQTSRGLSLHRRSKSPKNTVLWRYYPSRLLRATPVGDCRLRPVSAVTGRST